MPNIISKLHNKDNKISKRKFIFILAGIFVVFGITGYFLAGLLTSFNGSNDEEKSRSTVISNNKQEDSSKSSYKGYVKYVDPNFYPNEKISFVLNNSKGKEIILLKADDQKLQVVEGHYVTAKGVVYNSKYGDFDYLMVDEVVIENVTN